MNAVKEQLGVLILVAVLIILLFSLWLFRTDHDLQLSIGNWIAGVLGALINLITGKVVAGLPPSITNSPNSIVSTTAPEVKP